MLRESRAAKRARVNAMGVNPMMANPMMGMNPLMAGMFPGMMPGMQASQQMPMMMPGMQASQQEDVSESEQEENTGSNGSQAAAPSVAAMSMAAAPAAPVVSDPAAPAALVEGAPEDFHSTLLSDAAISRSCTYLKNVPRNRLSDCLERLDPALEATYTAELSTNGLLALLWVWTRMKPCVKVSDLRHLTNIKATFSQTNIKNIIRNKCNAATWSWSNIRL